MRLSLDDEFACLDCSIQELRKPVIKKLADIMKMGHVPNRRDEEYGKFGCYVNCFVHACFNLTNKEIESLELDDVLYTLRSPFDTENTKSMDETKSELFDFLKQTGLQVEKFDPKRILKANQHKVALYFSQAYQQNYGVRDFHFLIQEPDNTWSGKCGGQSPYVDKFSKLENYLPFDIANKYQLNDVLVITNPHAPAEIQK